MEDPTPGRELLLLKEYELCGDSAHKLESTIWQTSAAIGIGSIGSLVLLIRAQPPWLVASAVGVLVNVAVCIWWHMARRWWSIQHAKFRRMRHIEECLHLYQTRYIDYLDDATDHGRRHQNVEGLHDLIRRYLPGQWEAQDLEDLRGGETPHQRKGVQYYLRCFPCLSIIVWVVYVGYLLVPRFACAADSVVRALCVIRLIARHCHCPVCW